MLIRIDESFLPPRMSDTRPASAPDTFFLRVHAAMRVADGVLALDLRSPSGALLPPFTAGAHIDLHLPEVGVVRQYSISSDPADRTRYVVGVALDASSRGGSRFVHEQVRAGDLLTVGLPRNNFPLAEDARASVFIGGGIGVTPLLAMARRLSALGRAWTFYLCARTPERAAFLQEMLLLPHGRVVPVFDGVPGVAPLDLFKLVREAAPDAHFYCCGPAPMMEAFTEATRHIDPARVHVEWFTAPANAKSLAPASGAFVVRLQRSGKALEVAPEESLLDALARGGISVPSSCRDGICGTCEVRVLAGTPDHRDLVLSAADRDKGDRMFVCVSRCNTAELLLDL